VARLSDERIKTDCLRVTEGRRCGTLNPIVAKVLTPVLVIHEGGKPTRALPLRGANVVVGCDDDCDLVLADPSVNERHAEVKAVGDKHIIHDLESDHGIFVGGRRVEFHVLRPGDRVQIGAFEVEYLQDDREAASLTANQAGWEMDAATYRELVERQGSIRLDMGIKQAATIISEDDPRQSWKPDDGMVFGPQGVPVEGIGANAGVVWDGRAHVIKRLGWRSSLSVNGQVVDTHVLASGDRFQVGRSRFRYT
jgi:hypothetical protein